MNLKAGRPTKLGCALIVSLVVSGCAQAKVADTYNEMAKTIAVRQNMNLVQNAAEAYFKDHTYMYPTEIDDDFKSYFQDGDPKTKKAGKAPLNPFTGSPEWPIKGKITDLSAARIAVPDALSKGVLEYSPLENGKSYAIRAGSEVGKAIKGENDTKMGTLVISRDSFAKEGTQ